MRAIKFSLTAALAASVLSLSPSFATDRGAPREVTVYYEELNTSSDRATADLYGRLRSASRHVCSAFQGRELRQRAAFNACFEHALSNAVERVNRISVTALHMKTVKGAEAS